MWLSQKGTWKHSNCNKIPQSALSNQQDTFKYKAKCSKSLNG